MGKRFSLSYHSHGKLTIENSNKSQGFKIDTCAGKKIKPQQVKKCDLNNTEINKTEKITLFLCVTEKIK